MRNTGEGGVIVGGRRIQGGARAGKTPFEGNKNKRWAHLAPVRKAGQGRVGSKE